MTKCILIGNSSNILGKKHGSTIDNFDIVVRFNRFRIVDFEQDLGTKCTHWVLNYALTTDGRDYLVKNLKKVKTFTNSLAEALVFTTAKDNGKINQISKLVDIKVTYKQFKRVFDSKPTTGFLAIRYFLDLYDNVTLAGFDFGKSNHYWGNKGASDIPGKHEWDKEYRYVLEKCKEGKINIL